MENRERVADDTQPRAVVQLALRQLVHAETRVAPPPPGVDWMAVCDLAATERVAALLHWAWRDLPGLPAAAATRLADAYHANAERSRVYLGELGSVLDALGGAGIAVLVLKGAALAETIYADAALRRMSDIDLLVGRPDLARAREVLAPLGFAPLFAEPRPGEAEYESQCLLRKEGPVRVRIELHWSLFDSPFYQHRLPMSWFWETAEPATIGGRPARMLGPAAQVLHLCAHLRLHHSGSELRWLHDVALFVRTHGARIDWPLVCDRARQFDLVLPLRDVLDRVAAGWGAVPDPVLQRVRALEPSRRETRVFRWLTETDRDAGRRLWIDLLTQPGWRPRLAFAWTNLVPSAAYMRRRYGIRHPLLLPFYYPYRWLRGLRGFARQFAQRA